MKNIRFFSICLIITLFGVISKTNAQNTVMSGSFQFINDINKRAGVLVLQSSTQKFESPIMDNIIIANLLPGRYSLIIEYQIGGRGGRMTKFSQNIDIESDRRTVCRMNASAMLSFAKEYDRNSIPILAIDNYRGFDRNFDRDDRRDNNTFIPLPAPMPISDADFNQLYNSVRNEKFSDTKMRTLKTSAKFHEFFTSEQVKRLALLFNTDDDKLECVKYLTPKVLDVQNLPYIKDVFTFTSTKDAYLRFLGR